MIGRRREEKKADSGYIGITGSGFPGRSPWGGGGWYPCFRFLGAHLPESPQSMLLAACHVGVPLDDTNESPRGRADKQPLTHASRSRLRSSLGFLKAVPCLHGRFVYLASGLDRPFRTPSAIIWMDWFRPPDGRQFSCIIQWHLRLPLVYS